MRINDVVVIKPATLIALINCCNEDFVGYIGLIEEISKKMVPVWLELVMSHLSFVLIETLLRL